MPEEDPLQQMIDAGLYEQRLRQLQQRYQLGQGWMQPQQAAGAQVGNTYVAASPFEHLSNAIRQLVGAKMAGGAMQGERDLTGQVAAGRKAFAQRLQTAGGVPGPGVPEMLARPADPQEMQRLAMMGAGSGDPAMMHAAQISMQGQHYQNELARLQNTQRYQEGMLDLKGREQKTQFDPLGNAVTTPTHAPGPSLLPRSTGAGGGANAKKTPWSQEALDKDAANLAVSGDYKRMQGKVGAAYDLAVRRRSVELFPDAERAPSKAEYVSNVGSLRKMQLTADSIDAFESTALKNGKLMLDAAKGIVDVGSPFFNKPLRAIQQQFAGDPRMTKFNAARQVFVQEAGRVLGGAVAGGALTEGQRHEVEGLVSGSATIPQMEATLQTLEADMGNRKAATQAALQAIRGRMSGKPAAASPATPPAAGGAQAPAATARVRYQGKMLDIPAARLAEALRDGAVEVK